MHLCPSKALTFYPAALPSVGTSPPAARRKQPPVGKPWWLSSLAHPWQLGLLESPGVTHFPGECLPRLFCASLNRTSKFWYSLKAFEVDKQLYLVCFVLVVMVPRLIREHIQNHGPWTQCPRLMVGADVGSIKKMVSRLALLLTLPLFYFNESLLLSGGKKRGTSFSSCRRRVLQTRI